jgi:hypothetical protein
MLQAHAKARNRHFNAPGGGFISASPDIAAAGLWLPLTADELSRMLGSRQPGRKHEPSAGWWTLAAGGLIMLVYSAVVARRTIRAPIATFERHAGQPACSNFVVPTHGFRVQDI